MPPVGETPRGRDILWKAGAAISTTLVLGFGAAACGGEDSDPRQGEEITAGVSGDGEVAASPETPTSVMELDNLQAGQTEAGVVAGTVLGQVDEYLANGEAETLVGFSESGRADVERLRESGVTGVAESDEADWTWVIVDESVGATYLCLEEGSIEFETPDGSFELPGEEGGDLTRIHIDTTANQAATGKIVGHSAGLGSIACGPESVGSPEEASPVETTTTTPPTTTETVPPEPEVTEPEVIYDLSDDRGRYRLETKPNGEIWRVYEDGYEEFFGMGDM